MEFKHKVDGFDPAMRSRSQAGQDLFVIAMLEGRRCGTYLEIGCFHPTVHSNTFNLERFYDFSGDSIDIKKLEWNVKDWRETYNNLKGMDWPQDPPEDVNDLPDWVKQECINLGFDLYPGTWVNRSKSNYIIADALELDYSGFPYHYDYLQIDIDPPINNLKVLKKVIKNHRYSVITFEHDAWRQTEETEMVRKES